jgi:MIP family channel proteins
MTRAFAEAIGTFALIFVGVLSITGAGIAGSPELVNLTSVALAHGFTIAVMVAALGAISGGHFNPAVTFGFVITGRMRARLGLIYWVAQLAGATVAALLLTGMFGIPAVSDGTPDLARGISSGTGILIEAVATFFLVLVIFGTAVDQRAPVAVFPLAIGLTIALDIMAVGPLTGAAMNPARTFGPALAAGHWSHHFVYWVGPLVGATAAAVVQHGLLMERPAPATRP